MAQDFKNTMNMPQTEFPMRGNLPKREPDVLAKWETERLYDLMMQVFYEEVKEQDQAKG